VMSERATVGRASFMRAAVSGKRALLQRRERASARGAAGAETTNGKRGTQP
jgi:hypothetical protein